MRVNFEDLPLDRGVRLIQGKTLYIPVELWHNGAPVNLTDCTVTFTLVDDAGDAVVGPSPVTPHEPLDGKFIARAESSSTDDWLPGDYTYEVEVTFPAGSTLFIGGAVVGVLSGTVTVVPTIMVDEE